jgi:hypothetical protein
LLIVRVIIISANISPILHRSAVGELIADIFGSSDEDEEFEA